MFLGVEISALQRHWAVQICKQVFMLIFLLLIEYQVWLFTLRSAVTQSTVCESLSTNQSKVAPETWFIVMDSSHGEGSHCVMAKDLNEVVIPNFTNNYVEVQD